MSARPMPAEGGEKVVADVLREARRLIEEKGWCQGFYAHSRTGRNVFPDSKSASSFCVVGALWRAKPNGSRQPEKALISRAIGLPHEAGHGLSTWNDEEGRTKEEVLAAFDRAIAHARGDAARQERT